MDIVQKRISETAKIVEQCTLEISPEDKKESPEQKKKRIAKLEADPEAWFAYYFRKYASATPAEFHKEASRRVLSHPEWYEVRMWSRELAKSTRTMMEVLYLTLVGYPKLSSLDKEEYPTGGGGLTTHLTPPSPSERVGERFLKKYILMISNSYDNACRLLLPYKFSLEKNQYLIRDYGEQKKFGHWKSGEFITKQGVAFRALGAGQSPRGTRNEEVRPDVILFDDVDTDADCLNPQLIAKKWRWIEEAAISTRSVSIPLLIIFCGNRIAIDCCVERAAKYANHTDVINILDENDQSTWPQKNSLADIERVLGQKSYTAQQKEYFNNPILEGSVFKEMAYKPAKPLHMYSILVCYTDPSFKDTKKNDYKATVLVGKCGEEIHVIRCYLEQTSTAKMVEWHFDIMDYVGSNACYYFIEENLMQDALTKAFNEEGNRKDKLLPIKPDRRSKQDKFTRIESLLEPLNSGGKLFLNADEKSNPHMMRLEEQFLAIAPKSRAHDDGPDAVEGAVFIINNKTALLKPGSFMTAKRPTNSKQY